MSNSPGLFLFSIIERLELTKSMSSISPLNFSSVKNSILIGFLSAFPVFGKDVILAIPFDQPCSFFWNSIILASKTSELEIACSDKLCF